MELQNNQNLSQSSNEPRKKSYWKFILGFLAIMLAVLFGYPIGKNIYYSYVADKSIKNTLEMQARYLDALKNDKFGGKTPQETYEKFVDTLKSGNVLNAAKFYMRDEDKVSAYKKFSGMQIDGSLANWIAELPSWSAMKEADYWDPNGKEFDYEYVQKNDEIVKIPATNGGFLEQNYSAGKHTKAIIFEINKSANIWKIYEL